MISYKRNIFILLIALISFSSCVSLKEIEQVERELDVSNFSAINGRYYAQSDSFCSLNLADLLEVDHFLKFLDLDGHSDSLVVELKVINQKKVQMTVFLCDSIISSHFFKGKLENNCFTLKTQTNTEFDLLFFIYSVTKQKTRLYLNNRNYLIVDSESKLTSFILFVPDFTYKKQRYNIPFKKLE